MKSCLRRARHVVVRDCDTGLYAASARERAIACLSTDVRPRCNSEVRSDGNARARRRNLGNTVDCLTVSRHPGRRSLVVPCQAAERSAQILKDIPRREIRPTATIEGEETGMTEKIKILVLLVEPLCPTQRVCGTAPTYCFC
jgi:hypothetical protein